MRQSTVVPGLAAQRRAITKAHGVSNIQLYEMRHSCLRPSGRQDRKPKERTQAGVRFGGRHERQGLEHRSGVHSISSTARVRLRLSLASSRCRRLRFKCAFRRRWRRICSPVSAAEVLSGGDVIGWVGELHPLAADAFDAQAPVVAFELDMDALVKSSRPARDYVDVPTLPAVQMDVAFVVDEGVTHERLMQCMISAGGKLLESAQLFDVYRDDARVGAGKKSMAFALTYRAADRTLTSEEAEKTHERLVKKVCAATGAEVRG